MEMVTPAWFPLWGTIIVLIVFGSICFRKPKWGIYVIAATLPSYLIRLTVFGIPTTVLELGILILFFIWLIRNGRWKRINVRWWKTDHVSNPIPFAFRAPLALILASAFVATLISPNQPAALGILKAYFIDPILFFIVFVYEMRNDRDRVWLVRAVGILVWAIGIFALVQSVTGVMIPNPFWADPLTRRVTTFFGYPNASGLLVAPIVALYAGRLASSLHAHWQRTRGTFRMLYLPADSAWSLSVTLLGLMTILASQTTGAFVALVFSVWLLALLNKKIRIWLVPSTLALCFILALSPLIQTRLDNLRDRVSRNYLDLSSSSLEIRISQWRETLSFLSNHPITGAGLASYQQALAPYHHYDFLEIYLYPHNLFLNFWTELGLLGLIAFVWLLLVIARTLRNAFQKSAQPRWLIIGLTAAWSTVIVHGLVDVPYFKNDLSVLWMLLVGLTVAVTNNLQPPPSSAGDTYRA